MLMAVDENPVVSESVAPTIWGLPTESIHDRYWASRGVQVVRPGQRIKIDPRAEIFLLINPTQLILFDLLNWIDILNWTKPDLLCLRLNFKKNLGYREVLTADQQGKFFRFERRYKVKQNLATRVGLTCDAEIAEAWQASPDCWTGWRRLRSAIPAAYREVRGTTARIYPLSVPEDVRRFVEDLVGIWTYPGSTIARVHKEQSNIWVDRDAKIDSSARIVGPVWIGAGREVLSTDVVVGPAVLWDNPDANAVAEDVAFGEIEPSSAGPRLHLHLNRSSIYPIFKRGFDIVFSLIALLFTLPFYPLIMFAVWWEDGLPVFFSHERETLDGRIFRCLKFRSMKRGAAQQALVLTDQNQADGPQFFIENDPRTTRVGRFIRKAHLDELPQFINVLLGQMSLVGPRPSPRIENQYSPEWRETRLSVRPGITGLWQVRRTRLRGRDFQEWIKYDIQYVENMSLALDLKLIWQTFVVIIRRAVRS